MKLQHAIGAVALAAFAGLLGQSRPCVAAPVGLDNASAPAYDDGWQVGDDGYIVGDAAFGPWAESQSGNAGTFTGSSTNLAGGSGANIDSEGESFGLYSFDEPSDTSPQMFSFAGRTFAGDGSVDGADFLKWQRDESPNAGSAPDLAAGKAAVGAASDATGWATNVPEPATIRLCVGPVVALIIVARHLR